MLMFIKVLRIVFLLHKKVQLLCFEAFKPVTSAYFTGGGRNLFLQG